METDIRGPIQAGIQFYLVLNGFTQIENVGDYVYQPTRLLQSVADLTAEVLTGKVSDRLESPAFSKQASPAGKHGLRHRTDIFAFHKPRPRPAKTK